MPDFAVLPPEVNSARMYSGAGSSPMLSAAASWDRLAATLGSASSSYQAVLAQLTDGSWRGPASAAMLTAAQPYVQWMSATAAKASQAAGQARAAAAAYESAFTATVPPPVVAANRTQLQVLLAHNVFGQNAGAIAANQAEYGQMWAQDAAAMHGYAASSAATTGTLSPFSPAPQTTNPVGQAQNGGTQGGIEGFLMSALNNPLVDGFNQFSGQMAGFNGFIGGSQFLVGGITLGGPNWGMLGAIAAMYTWTALNPWSVGLMSSVSGSNGTAHILASATNGAGSSSGVPVSAKSGGSAPIGRLSAPQSWAANAPQMVRPLAASMPALAGSGALPATGMGGMGAPALIPPMGAANAGRGSSGTGDKRQDSDDGVGVPGAWTERDELNRMRQAVVAQEMQRDALKRSAAIVIKKVRERQRER